MTRRERMIVSADSPKGAERRRHLRLELEEQAMLLLLEQEKAMVCWLVDIAEGGCRLALDHPLPDVDHKAVEITFRAHGISLRFAGEIVWTHELEIGVEFGLASERGRTRLGELLGAVASELKQHPAAIPAESSHVEVKAVGIAGEVLPPDAPLPPAH